VWGVGTVTQDTMFHALLARHVPQIRRATAYGLFDALRGTAWLLSSVVIQSARAGSSGDDQLQ
jgi:hypothetical protein